MAFQDSFRLLNDVGLFDVLLPFVLIFTLVFAVLQKVRIFDDKRINTMLALIMGLGTIAPHVLWGTPNVPDDAVLVNGMPDIVEIINNSLPSVSLILVAILMALIIIGILGRRVELGNTSLSGWIALLSFVMVVVVFLTSAGVFRNVYLDRWVNTNPDLTALVIVILVFAIIIWFVTKDDSESSRISREKFGDKLTATLLGDK